MVPFPRRKIALVGLLLVAAAGYSFAARQELLRPPVHALEAIVERYELRYDCETNAQISLGGPAKLEIRVRPQWGSVELRDNGMGIGGRTAWDVGVAGWSVELQQALLRALNNSPATARQLASHPDERIQFLLLKVLSDWGYGLSLFPDADGRREPWNLRPHAVEALLELAGREDPHTVGTVLASLSAKRQFSSDVFLAAMEHQSSNIRAEALCWLDREREQLTTAEIQAVAPVLIEHLTDRDLVVREWSFKGVRSLAATWEQGLGGATYDAAYSDQRTMTKLPVAPASEDWYRVVSPRMSEAVQSYQAEWEAWLELATQTL